MDFSECSESKIGNFQIHVVVNKDIFKFQISMNDSLAVHVFKDFAHLVKEKASTVLSHASQSLAYIEQETTCHKFQENVNQVLNGSTGWFDDLTIRAITKNLDDIVMFKSLKNLNFGFD